MITRQLTGLPRWHSGKESACQCRRHKRWGFDPWGRKIPWRRKWQPTPIFLPGKFHGQRSMASYSPWGRKEHIYTGTTVDYTNTALYLYGAYDSKYFHFYVLIRSSLLICIVFNPHFMDEEIEAERIYLAWPWSDIVRWHGWPTNSELLHLIQGSFPYNLLVFHRRHEACLQ